METTDKSQFYRVWGSDKVAYGPLGLSTLGQWIKEERVAKDSWVFCDTDDRWCRAGEAPELKPFFAPEMSRGAATAAKEATAKRRPAFTAAALRRIKLFDQLEEAQLESFMHYLEVAPFPQFSHIVREGQHGDAMYLVMEGEARALTVVEGKESTLATLTVGDFFGEISLLDQGPRSADVIANKDSVMLRLSSATFDRLLREAPALSVPFLLALVRTGAFRMRRLTKKYEDSIRFIRTSGVLR